MTGKDLIDVAEFDMETREKPSNSEPDCADKRGFSSVLSSTQYENCPALKPSKMASVTATDSDNEDVKATDLRSPSPARRESQSSDDDDDDDDNDDDDGIQNLQREKNDAMRESRELFNIYGGIQRARGENVEMTPLHAAAIAGNVRILRTLLRQRYYCPLRAFGDLSVIGSGYPVETVGEEIMQVARAAAAACRKDPLQVEFSACLYCSGVIPKAEKK